MAVALTGNQMPQPNTFTRSKDDILNALSFYFGQPVSPEKLKDYNEHHAATCARPASKADLPHTRCPSLWQTLTKLHVVPLQIISPMRTSARTPSCATYAPF